jgi:hypothetical protein
VSSILVAFCVPHVNARASDHTDDLRLDAGVDLVVLLTVVIQKMEEEGARKVVVLYEQPWGTLVSSNIFK